ncbi:MAG TPA: hypothetical protein VN630_07630 [Rhodanobacteraceae bacterium]|nr:hypothetical protein [Rhodanobacteraceae bacterium]
MAKRFEIPGAHFLDALEPAPRKDLHGPVQPPLNVKTRSARILLQTGRRD